MNGPVRQARPRYVPADAPKLTTRERLEWAMFVVGLVAIPFVLVVLPR